MRTSALFGARNFGLFEIYGMSARTRGVEPVKTFFGKGGWVFRDYARTSSMNGFIFAKCKNTTLLQSLIRGPRDILENDIFENVHTQNIAMLWSEKINEMTCILEVIDETMLEEEDTIGDIGGYYSHNVEILRPEKQFCTNYLWGKCSFYPNILFW